MISASDCLDKAPDYNLLAGCIEDSMHDLAGATDAFDR